MTFDAAPILESLAIPVTEATVSFLHSLGIDGVHSLDAAIDVHLAQEIWRNWNGDDDRIDDGEFSREFRRLLANGVAMGLSLARFRYLSASLPAPGPNGAHWIAAFEREAAGRDRCNIRLSLNPARLERYLAPAATPSEDTWNGLIHLMRDGLFYELGIIYPDITVTSDPDLGDAQIRIEWNDLRLPAREGIPGDRLLVNASPEDLRDRFGIDSRPARNPANDSACALIHVSDRQRCEDPSYTIWDDRGYAILQLSSVLRRGAGAFVNRFLVDHLLDQLAQYFPVVVEETDARFDRDFLTQVLRSLAQEEISIRDLRKVLSGLVAASPVDSSANLWENIVFDAGASRPLFPPARAAGGGSVSGFTEFARAELKRYISHKYTRGANTLVVYLLAPQTEARLRQAEPLSHEEFARLADAVREEGAADPVRNAVILTSLEVRAILRQALKPVFPKLAVLSYQELSPDMNIQPIARIDPDIAPYD